LPATTSTVILAPIWLFRKRFATKIDFPTFWVSPVYHLQVTGVRLFYKGAAREDRCKTAYTVQDDMTIRVAEHVLE
jgi:hypothetical protein